MKRHPPKSSQRPLKKRLRSPSVRLWRSLFHSLVERYRRKGGSDFDACKRLAPALSRAGQVLPHWSANYLVQVLHRSEMIKPSPRFKMAVVDLYKAKPRVRVDLPRHYISFKTRKEIEYVKAHLTPDDKREILLAAASHEDFDE